MPEVDTVDPAVADALATAVNHSKIYVSNV
jgi:hypothetical protein